MQRAVGCLLLMLGLAGCVTLSEPDQTMLRQHQVSTGLYAKMVHRERISLTDIIELSEKRVSPAFTLRYLRSTGAVYRLSSDDVVTLRRARVDRGVIDYLLQTPALYAPVADPFWYNDDPLWWGYYPRSYYFYGGGHGHHHHHHHGKHR